jgi:hypothetical protein
MKAATRRKTIKNPVNWYVVDARYKKISDKQTSEFAAQKIADIKNAEAGEHKYFVISVGNENYDGVENGLSYNEWYKIPKTERNRLALKVYREKRKQITSKDLLKYYPENPTNAKLWLLVTEDEVMSKNPKFKSTGSGKEYDSDVVAKYDIGDKTSMINFLHNLNIRVGETVRLHWKGRDYFWIKTDKNSFAKVVPNSGDDILKKGAKDYDDYSNRIKRTSATLHLLADGTAKISTEKHGAISFDSPSDAMDYAQKHNIGWRNIIDLTPEHQARIARYKKKTNGSKQGSVKNPNTTLAKVKAKVKLRTNNGSKPVALESFTDSEQEIIVKYPNHFEIDDGYVYLVKHSRNGKQGSMRKTIANASGELDEQAANELYLYATNDSDLYRQQIVPIYKNLVLKQAKGIYSKEKAIKLAMYLMDNAAKKYAKEFGRVSNWHYMFTTATRRSAAKEFIEHFENESGYGNFDNLLPAKYQKNGKQGSVANPNKKLDAVLDLKSILTLIRNTEAFKRQPDFFTDKLERFERVYGNYLKQTERNTLKGAIRASKSGNKTALIDEIWYLQDSISRYARLDLPASNKTKPNFTNFDGDFDSAFDKLSKMFQGKVTKQKRNVLASDLQPSKTVRLGKLSKVIINGLNGKKYEIDSFGNDAFLSMDRRKNLWFSGADSRINLRANGIKIKNNQMHCLGYLVQVNYITDKKHIENGELVEYYHKLGEVNREKPTLWVDADGFLIANGGDYDVWKEGIVN